MNDDLLKPTVSTRASDLARPWRVDSLVYPGFFGGPLAAMALGLINGRRLGVGTRAILSVAAVGLVVLAARLAILVTYGDFSGSRVVGALAGVAVWGATWATQRRAFRSFELTGSDPARLVWPGLAAAVGGFFVEAFLAIAIVSITAVNR